MCLNLHKHLNATLHRGFDFNDFVQAMINNVQLDKVFKTFCCNLGFLNF